jgi:AraC-like DNA-binding protein
MLLKDVALFARVVPNVRSVLTPIGFDPVAAAPDDRVSVATYLNVTDRLLAQPGTDAMGLEVGVRTGSPREQGILGYTMLSCSTLLQALQLWQRYNALWPLWQWPFDGSFRQQGDTATLELVEPEHRVVSERLRVYGIEVWMGNWVATFSDLFGDGAHFSEAELAYPDPGYKARYEEVLRCPVRFGRPASLLHFPATLPRRPVHEGNDLVRAFCEQECSKMLADMQPQGGIIDRIRHILLRHAGQFPGMEVVADKLHMSERSLRRKLDAMDSSFKDILDDVRMHLASQYLTGSSMKTQQISELLGYSEVAAFNRAFKRWYGVPPSVHRGQAAEEAAEG